MYVSFDDGENWQSLRLNMPATSIRDLVVKDADLIVGTHGRGFWILDDITPLRQITPDITRAQAFLFWPAQAYRARWNMNTDTPLPPDEPTAPNPPDGVTFTYLIGQGVTGPINLEIVEGLTGEVIRHFSSDDPPDAARGRAQHPRLLAAPGRDALDRAWPASIRVGHAICSAAG